MSNRELAESSLRGRRAGLWKASGITLLSCILFLRQFNLKETANHENNENRIRSCPFDCALDVRGSHLLLS